MKNKLSRVMENKIEEPCEKLKSDITDFQKATLEILNKLDEDIKRLTEKLTR